MKQLVDYLVIQASCPLLQKIFLFQINTGKQTNSSSYCRLHGEKVKKRSGTIVKNNCLDICLICLQILLRGGPTISSINLVNSVGIAFAILDYSFEFITQFDVPPCTVSKRILCHVSSDSFKQYTWSILESVRRGFCNRAVANFFLNNKRKPSTDSAFANGVNSLKKDREKSKLENFLLFFKLLITLNFYFIF